MNLSSDQLQKKYVIQSVDMEFEGTKNSQDQA